MRIADVDSDVNVGSSSPDEKLAPKPAKPKKPLEIKDAAWYFSDENSSEDELSASASSPGEASAVPSPVEKTSPADDVDDVCVACSESSEKENTWYCSMLHPEKLVRTPSPLTIFC